jgi:hypothetical protein
MTTGNLVKLAALAWSTADSLRDERSYASKVFGKDWRGAMKRRGQQSWLAVQVRPAAEQLLCATRRCSLV